MCEIKQKVQAIDFISRSVAKHISELSGLSKSSFYTSIRDCKPHHYENNEPIYKIEDFIKFCKPRIPEVNITVFGTIQIGKTTFINALLNDKSAIINPSSNSIVDGVTAIPKRVNAYTKKLFFEKYSYLNDDSNELRCLNKILFRPKIVFEIINNHIVNIKLYYRKEIEEDLNNLIDKVFELNDIDTKHKKFLARISADDIISFYLEYESLFKKNKKDILEKFIEKYNESDLELENIGNLIIEMLEIPFNKSNEMKEKYGIEYSFKATPTNNNDYTNLDTLLKNNSEILLDIKSNIKNLFETSFKKATFEKDTLPVESIFNKYISKVDIQNDKNISNIVSKYIKQFQIILSEIGDSLPVSELMNLDSTEFATIVDLIEYDGVQNSYFETKARINVLSILDTKGTNDRTNIQANSDYFKDNDLNIIVTNKSEREYNILETFNQTEIQKSKLGFIYVEKDLNRNTDPNILKKISDECIERTEAYRQDFISKNIIDSQAIEKDLTFSSLFSMIPNAIMPYFPKNYGKVTQDDTAFAINNLMKLFDEVILRKIKNIKLLFEGIEKVNYEDSIDRIRKNEENNKENNIQNLINCLVSAWRCQELIEQIGIVPKNTSYIRENLKYSLCSSDKWSNSYTYHYVSKMGYSVITSCWKISYDNLVKGIKADLSEDEKYKILMFLAFLEELGKYLNNKPVSNAYEWWTGVISTQRLSLEAFELTKVWAKNKIINSVNKSYLPLSECFDIYIDSFGKLCDFYSDLIFTCISKEIDLFKNTILKKDTSEK